VLYLLVAAGSVLLTAFSLSFILVLYYIAAVRRSVFSGRDIEYQTGSQPVRNEYEPAN